MGDSPIDIGIERAVDVFRKEVISVVARVRLNRTMYSDFAWSCIRRCGGGSNEMQRFFELSRSVVNTVV